MFLVLGKDLILGVPQGSVLGVAGTLELRLDVVSEAIIILSILNEG